MTNLLKKSLARKLVLLFALGTAMVYLHKPQQAQAQTCIQNCETAFTACTENCKDNKSCISECVSAEEACIECCLYC